MPLYLDIHNKIEGLTGSALGDAHQKDLAVQGKHGVKYIRYWFDEGTGKVFCLVEAPSKEAAAAVHREGSPRLPRRRDHRGAGRGIAPACSTRDGLCAVPARESSDSEVL